MDIFKKNGLLSTTLAELINTALKLTAEVNLKIRSVTCDAEKVNISASKILGCNLFSNNHEEIINYFSHPSENYKIYIIISACHMLKLTRNALADLQEIEYNSNTVKWNYIIQLHKLQNNLTFKLKNKLNSQCIL